PARIEDLVGIGGNRFLALAALLLLLARLERFLHLEHDLGIGDQVVANDALDRRAIRGGAGFGGRAGGLAAERNAQSEHGCRSQYATGRDDACLFHDRLRCHSVRRRRPICQFRFLPGTLNVMMSSARSQPGEPRFSFDWARVAKILASSNRPAAKWPWAVASSASPI